MRTLAELQQAMESGTTEQKAKAGKELADFYFVYNEEYNALLIAKQRAEVELDAVKHAQGGVNTAAVFSLQALILAIESRLALLDLKMLAFHESSAEIRPPDAGMITKVKTLSGQVAKAQLKADTAERVMQDVAELGRIGGPLFA